MRAAVYLRQSRDDSGEGQGIGRQREDCERLAQQRGWDIVEVLPENDTSAEKTGRPMFARLMQMIRDREVEAVIAWSLDRLTRNRRDTVTLVEAGQATGATIALCRGSDMDMSTPAGRLAADILASVARHEIEQKSDRQKRRNKQAADAGKPPQRRAFGYTDNGMELVADEAKAVQDLYSKVLAGMTLVAATRLLNDQGFRTTRGGEWKRSNVRWLLLNPRYAGVRVYDQVEMPGTWPAIIDQDTHQAMKSMLSDPKRKKNQGTARRWLGAGLYLCGRCGDDPSDVRVNYRDDGNRIYRCRASAHLSRLADPVDEFVTEVVTQRLRRPDLADLLAGPDDSNDLHQEAAGLRARLDSLAADYADGLLTARQVSVATERLDARLTDIEARQAARGQRSALAAVMAKKDPAQAWLDADLSVQREVVSLLVESITLLRGARGRFDPDSVVIRWR
jgi:DNA invertase Pin-like site-specific DNA recombinase